MIIAKLVDKCWKLLKFRLHWKFTSLDFFLYSLGLDIRLHLLPNLFFAPSSLFLSFCFPSLQTRSLNHTSSSSQWLYYSRCVGASPVAQQSRIRLPVQDMSLIPGSGRSPGGGNGNPLQYSCLGNVMDSRAWWATVHGVTKSWHNLARKQQQQQQMCN